MNEAKHVEDTQAPAQDRGPLRWLEPKQLLVDPKAARKVGIGRLAESIREYGQLVPVLVTELTDGTLHLDDGTRRYEAFRLLEQEDGGPRKIMALVRRQDEAESALPEQSLKSLVANAMRMGFTTLDRIRHTVELIEALATYGEKYAIQKRVAQILDLSEATVSCWLAIYGNPELHSLMYEGVEFSAARAIYGIRDPDELKRFCDRLREAKQRRGRFPSVRIISRAARHAGSRSALLDGNVDFDDLAIILGPKGLVRDKAVDHVLDEVSRWRKENGAKMPKEQLAALVASMKGGGSRITLDDEAGRRMLAYLASSEEPATVEFRPLKAPRATRVVVFASEHLLAALEAEDQASSPADLAAPAEPEERPQELVDREE